MAMGDTKVLVTATVESRVPPFLRGTGQGWVTAEYGMLPRATADRTPREAQRGRQGGRTVEIQRLIGRSLRGMVDLVALGERTVLLDCDVLQADGGTRTCAVNAAVVATAQALARVHAQQPFATPPLRDWLGAISIGWGPEGPLLDLDYEEDSRIAVDLNLVMTAGGRIVEIQGTGEREGIDRAALLALLDAGEHGIERVMARTRAAAGEVEGLAAVLGPGQPQSR